MLDQSHDDMLRGFAADAEQSANWWTNQARWHAKTGNVLRQYDCLEMAGTMMAEWAKWQRKLAERDAL